MTENDVQPLIVRADDGFWVYESSSTFIRQIEPHCVVGKFQWYAFSESGSAWNLVNVNGQIRFNPTISDLGGIAADLREFLVDDLKLEVSDSADLSELVDKIPEKFRKSG